MIGEGVGKSKGGLTSKIHIVTDEKGNAIHILITDVSMHNSTQGKNLLYSMMYKGVYVLGDRAYNSNEIVNYIRENNAVAVIPPRKNRKKREYEKEIYKNCNQIECFFNHLKQYRRIATKYDKLVSSFLSLV